MIQKRRVHDKRGPLANRLHWVGPYLSIIIFSFIFITQGCTRSGNEQVATPTVPPRVYPAWVKTFTGQDILNSVHQTTDGGFIMAGKAHSPQGYHDAWIVKFDAGGNVQWQRGFGERYQDEFLSVIQTNDNGYLAIGMTILRGSVEQSGLILKLDAEGNLQWQKTIPRTVFKSALQTSDGDFILTGGSSAFGATGLALVIFRLGPDGRSKWQKVYGEGDGCVVRQTSDGGYIALASAWGLGRYETLILKTDGNGAAQWQKQYGSFLNAIEQMADGGFLLAGTVSIGDKQRAGRRYPFGPGNLPSGPSAVNVQGWLLRLDRDGVAQWQKLYGGVFEDEFKAMRKTRDGKLIVLGNTMNYGAGNGDLWLLLLDESGTIIWQKTIGGPQRESANDLQPTADGGYLIVGKTLSLGPGAERALLAKVDETGDIPGCSLLAFNVSNSAAEDVDISPSLRPFPTKGEDISLSLSNSAIPSVDQSVAAASYCPPQPKLVLSSTNIKVGPTSKKALNRIQMRIWNAGAADLSIKEMKITKKQEKWSWIANIWALITRRSGPTYSVVHTCAAVGPGLDCSYTVAFKSSSSGKTEATLTIISNDPDTPVVAVPIHATVR